MTPTEREHLRRILAEKLDEAAAATLMESLPPMDWHELARQDDILVLREDLEAVKVDMAEVKSDVAVLKTDVAVLKTDMAEVKTDVAELKADMVGVRNEIVVLRHELTASFRGELALQTRSMIFGMVGVVVAMGGFAVAIQQLG